MRRGRGIFGILMLGLAGAVFPSLVGVPAHAAFPPAGVVAFKSSAHVFITPIPPTNGRCMTTLAYTADVVGTTEIRHGAPYMSGGLNTFDIQISSMAMSGGGISIRQSSMQQPIGMVQAQAPGSDLPARMRAPMTPVVEFEAGPLTLPNAYSAVSVIQPEGTIYSWPPHGFPLEPKSPDSCVGLAPLGTGVPVLWMGMTDYLPITTRDCWVMSSGAFTLADSVSGTTIQISGRGEVQFIVPYGGAYSDGEVLNLNLSGQAVVTQPGKPPVVIPDAAIIIPPQFDDPAFFAGLRDDPFFFDIPEELKFRLPKFEPPLITATGSRFGGQYSAGAVLQLRQPSQAGTYVLTQGTIVLGNLVPEQACIGSYPPTQA